MIYCQHCNAAEGQLHDPFCYSEECPFCGGQLVSCNCPYQQINLYDTNRYPDQTAFLPPEVYQHGLDDAQAKTWLGILDAKGRIPFISYLWVCARCGTLSPELFRVPDEEWARYIAPSKRDRILCRPCFDEIKSLVDRSTHPLLTVA